LDFNFFTYVENEITVKLLSIYFNFWTCRKIR